MTQPNATPSPLVDLTGLVDEYKRILKGMLDGTMSRDDGLFAVARAGLRLAEHMLMLATYATPLLQSYEAMMAEAKRLAVEAQQATATPPAAPNQAPPMPQNVQIVEGVPAPSRLAVVPPANGEART